MMNQVITVVFSCLIFLISLFLFKVIFLALGITLAFLIVTIFFEYCQQTSLFLIKLVANPFITAISALALYSLLYLPLEFQITEAWLLIPEIPLAVNALVLMILIFVFSLVNWRKMFRGNKLALLVFSSVIFLSGFAYQEYRQQKLAREYLPKVYSLDPPQWGIQASLIEIKGVNFFPIWKKGKVFLGNEEMNIKSWGEKLIIAEQTVSTEFGPTRLYVKRSDGIVSNSIPFEIKNPNELR